MTADFIALGIYLALVLILLFGVLLGRIFGKWQIDHDPSHKISVVTVAEGGVFALLGLLIAFTFTGAFDRFEAQKIHVIEEADAIDTAYSRLNLLAPANRSNLHELFIKYIDSQVKIYSNTLDTSTTQANVRDSKALQETIMDEVYAGCAAQHDGSITQIVVPAFNTMFEKANTRYELSKIHSPVAIFAFLVGLAVLSAFLVGFSTAKKSAHTSTHILSYVLITALTLYLIIDLEFPRVGVIRVDGFDKILLDTKDILNERMLR